MNNTIHRPQVAKHQPRISDGEPHPVTVRHTAPKHLGVERWADSGESARPAPRHSTEL